MDTQKTFLAGTAALLTLISLTMLAPFLAYILTAIILAFVLRPLQIKLEPYIGGTISSALLILAFILIIALPFALAVGTVATDALELVDEIEDIEVIDLGELEQTIFDLTGQEIDLESELQELLERFTAVAVGGISQIVGVITSVAIGLLIMIFSLFYMLRDGDRLYNWIRSVTPVSEKIQKDLYSRAEIMTNAVLKGHVLVAIVEGLVGGLGLYLAGVPNFAFWTFIMILLSFIPVVGAFLVWAPASLYLFLIQQPVEGVFLFLYGAIIISFIDNVMRPYLVDSRAELHPAAILIGVLGGVYVFGAIGLFIGPVIFGLTKAVLDVFNANYKDL